MRSANKYNAMPTIEDHMITRNPTTSMGVERYDTPALSAIKRTEYMIMDVKITLSMKRSTPRFLAQTPIPISSFSYLDKKY